MSFGGGGSQQYFIDYIIRVKNEGTTGAGAFSQINQGMKQTQMGAINVTHAMEKMSATNQKVIQAGQGISKAMKGMAFGFLGLTTAGAEFFGMMSMWKATQQGVKEAQNEANKALAEGGKNSKEYKDAMMDVAKANRWAQMTFRNLMLSAFDLVPFFVLSVNGIIKLRSAYKLLREAQLEQKAMKEVMAAAGIKEAAAANLQTASYASLTAAQRKLKAEQALGITTLNAKTTATNVSTAANVSHNGSLITQIPLLGKQAKATDVVTASTTRLSKAMRVLQIAMKIAIPLVILEIGSQAFVNNWGGFADKLNAVGVAAGNAIPQLKGVFEIVGKLGRTVAAIFTGNFEDISKIWEGKDGKGFVPEELSENAKKEFDETIQKMQEFKSSSMDIFKEMGSADKGGLKDLMKTLGVTTGDSNIKGGKKEFKELTNILDETFTNLEETQQRFKTLEGFSILESIEGFADVDPKVIQKIRYALSSSLDDILGESDDDVFSQLAEVVKKNAKKSAPEFNAAVAQFVADHKGIEDEARKLGYPDLADYFAGLRADLQEQMRAGLGNLLTNESDEAEVWKDNWWDEQFKDDGGTGGGGLFTDIINKIKVSAGELGAAIDAVNWTELGAKVRTGLETIFTVQNAQALGGWIKTHLINPVMTELQKQIKPVVEAFAKDPIGYIVGAVNAISDIPAAFIAGLFGFKDAADMEEKLQGALYAFFNEVPMLQELRKIIDNPIGYLSQLLRGGGAARGDILAGAAGFAGAEASTFPERGRAPHKLIASAQNILDDLGITDFFDKVGEAWRQVENLIQGIGSGFTEFMNDPIGWLIGKIKGKERKSEDIPLSEVGIDVQRALGIPFPIPGTPDQPPKVPGYIPPGTTFNQALGGDRDERGVGWNFDAWRDVQDPRRYKNFGDTAYGGGPGQGMNTGYYAASGEFTQYGPKTKQSAATNNMEQWFPGFTAAVEAAKKKMDELSGVFQKVTTSMTTVWNAMTAALSTSWLAFHGSFSSTAMQLSEVMNTVSAAISGIWLTAHTGMFNTTAGWYGSIVTMWLGMHDNFVTISDAISTKWSKSGAAMLETSKSVSNETYALFNQALENVAGVMNNLASHWSKVCNSMINNAKSAASGIKNALDFKVTTIHEIKTIRTGGSLAGGGLVSLAEGGPISAATGKLLTTSGPTYLIGDNPGGHESIWAIPHNNPSPTVANINRMYGTQIRRGGGDASLNQNITVVIPGNDIVNDLRLNRRIRGTIGRRMDRFGS